MVARSTKRYCIFVPDEIILPVPWPRLFEMRVIGFCDAQLSS